MLELDRLGVDDDSQSEGSDVTDVLISSPKKRRRNSWASRGRNSSQGQWNGVRSRAGARKKWSWYGLVVLFLCGVGIQLGSQSVVAAIGFLKLRFGEECFVWINVALFGPLLPVSVMIRKLMALTAKDPRLRWIEDGRGTILSFVLGSLALAALGFLIEKDDKRLDLVVWCSLVIGVLSTFNHATLFAMVIQHDSDGYYEMMLAFGFGASCFVSLFAQIFYGFTALSDAHTFRLYLDMIAVAGLLCAVGVYLFCRDIRGWRTQEYVQVKDIEGNYNLETESLSSESSVASSMSATEKAASIAFWDVFKDYWDFAMVLFLTVFGSMFLFPFYSYVPSSIQNASFPSVLFYAKAIPDTLSRPLTIRVKHLFSRRMLFALSVVRNVIGIPFFFIYTFGNGYFSSYIPLSDTLFSLFVGIYSATSGLFITLAYQLSSIVVAHEYKCKEHGKQVSLVLNIFFLSGTSIALILGMFVMMGMKYNLKIF